MTSIDVLNAAFRMKQWMENESMSWDDAFTKISNKMDLTCDEMEELEKLVPFKKGD